MTLIALIAVVFIALLILPFVVAQLSVRKSKEASLYVKSDNVRDPRYFSNSFIKLVENGINWENRTIKMSKLEPFLYAEEISGSIIDTIVVAENRFHPTDVSSFQKEIYAKSSAIIPPKTILRAIACLEDLKLGEKCEVIRWADAERQLTVKDGCQLGMSATSAARLLIAPGCTFRRLYAPEIIIGHAAAEAYGFPADMTISDERWIDPEGVGADEIVRKTIVTEYSLDVGEGAVVMGSIKSNHHIYLRKGARVNGNVVADGAIILGEGVRVLSSVFSQDSILVGPDVEIGIKPKIKSLIARKSITLSESVKVFGYVGCEVDSITIPREDFQKELQKKQWKSKLQLMQAEIGEEKADDAVKEEPLVAVKAPRDEEESYPPYKPEIEGDYPDTEEEEGNLFD